MPLGYNIIGKHLASFAAWVRSKKESAKVNFINITCNFESDAAVVS